MGMPLEEWDADIAPVLSRVELDVSWLLWYSNSIKRQIQSLSMRPAWTTRAEEGIDKAISSLETSLKLLKEAQASYKSAKTGA